MKKLRVQFLERLKTKKILTRDLNKIEAIRKILAFVQDYFKANLDLISF